MSGAQSSFDAMTGYLLDTNVISETRKSRPDAGVIAFLSAAEGDGLFLSVLTLGELRTGVALKSRADPEAAGRLGAWVEGIAAHFEDRILPVDSAIALRWGELSASRNLPVIDALIAATALSRDLTLVTRNARDFELSGAPLLDPWRAR
jgi:toxin FitB